MSTQTVRNDGLGFVIRVHAQLEGAGTEIKPPDDLRDGETHSFTIDKLVDQYYLIAEFDAEFLSESLIFEPDVTHDFRVFNSWVRVVGNKARHVTHLKKIGNKDEDFLPPDDGGYKPPPPNP